MRNIVSKNAVKVCVIAIVGLSMSAIAGPLEVSSKTMMKKDSVAQKLYKCPTGWRLKTGSFRSNQTTVCVPKMPRSMNCPTGTSYVVDEQHCMISCQEALH